MNNTKSSLRALARGAIPFALSLAALVTLSACGGSGDNLSWQLTQEKVPLVASIEKETRTQESIAEGVTLYKFEIGSVSASDHFEVNVGFVRNQADATPLTSALASAGYATKFVATADGTTGYAIRLDKAYATVADADAGVAAVKALTTLPASSEALVVGVGRVYTAEDGRETSGPYRVNLLAITPQFKGTIKSALGTDVVPGRETTTSLASRLGALAAVNGGFFQFGRNNGTDGALAGLSIVDGRLINEGVEGRPALVIEKNFAQVNVARIERRLSTVLTIVTSAGTTKRIDGMNRRPQVAVNCGRPFDKETSVALHDAVCTNDNAIIAYTPDFGAAASTEIDGAVAVTEVAIDAANTVTAVSTTAGSSIPAQGRVLQGIGGGAAWLAANFHVGDKAQFIQKIVNGSGQELSLHAGMYAINGGPTLLVSGGTIDKEHAAEGWGNTNVAGYSWSRPNGNRANFYNGWYLRRNPRTAVGIAADGTILLMVSDGRAPAYSAGLSIRETALVMKHFGAVDAINLDGGGSSMMVVNGTRLTRPSDAGNVERADGDALLLMNN